MEKVDPKLIEWINQYPELVHIINAQPSLWFNKAQQSISHDLYLPLNKADMEKGRDFMKKYAPFISKTFPETAASNGYITSPLIAIDNFKTLENSKTGFQNTGNLLLKCDHALPVAGSIKARGGFYEVLQFAHNLSVKHGLIHEDGVADFNTSYFKELFSKYTIGVGSTGNLGLSIGIISAQLGFNVNVYMSHDAKQWKKQLLIQKGANVIEEDGDFSIAIAKGRSETQANPMGYFVDDENSKLLFLGYSLSAFEIQEQLKAQNIIVDNEHPLFVYHPCGVGGSAGGAMFGLKTIYGDAVHSFFAEPTHSPSVLTGLITGALSKISVQDIGLDNITEADGLAVGRASAFASSIIKKLVTGIYTINDNSLFELLNDLYQSENIFLEPSATAGLAGPTTILSSNYLKKNNIHASNITHIAWATGGSLIPAAMRHDFLHHEMSF